MRRSFAVLVLAFTLCVAPAAAQQRADSAEVWQARYVQALRVADDREARLLEDFDAERDRYLVRIREVAAARDVSEQTLAAVAVALGVAYAEQGQAIDPGTIFAAIAAGADQIIALEERIAA